MYSDTDQDKAFIAMMHDFVAAHRDRPATTESFKAVAERHMTKLMDLERNGRLDWFFNEWVYGTQVPRYHFEYQITPADAGKVKVHMTITQSEVDEHFGMLVPVFGDFGNGMLPFAEIAMGGNTTRNIDVTLARQPKRIALNAYKEILER
jgi:hypothetical protein